MYLFLIKSHNESNFKALFIIQILQLNDNGWPKFV